MTCCMLLQMPDQTSMSKSAAQRLEISDSHSGGGGEGLNPRLTADTDLKHAHANTLTHTQNCSQILQTVGHFQQKETCEFTSSSHLLPQVTPLQSGGCCQAFSQ